MYLSAWVKFLSLVYNARLKGASPEILDPWVAKYVNDLRNGRRDITADLQALGEICRTPATCLGYQSAIRTLLSEEAISLPPGGERRLRRARRQTRPPSGQDHLTPGAILKLLEHLDTRGRAILYVLASSGARLGETLSIRLEDLDLDSRPARARIRNPRTGASRVAFISREATGAIRVYLIVRGRFLASARSRGGRGDTKLLFPLGTRAFEQIWGLGLSKAGLERFDPVTKRRTLPVRATRRFFAERMSTVLPAPVIREMLGTTRRPPDPNFRFTDEELGRAYLDGEPAVTLHGGKKKGRIAGRIAELERLVAILQEQAGERDGEPARAGKIPEGAGREDAGVDERSGGVR
jgi:integrase